jgi:hypothetical protein
MVLPLILGLLGSGLGGAGMLGGLGALGAGAIGSGVGKYLETGDLEKGILTGLGSFAGGTLASKLMGGVAGNAAASGTGGTVKSILPELKAAQAAQASPLKAIGRSAMDFSRSAPGIGSSIGGALGGAMTGPTTMSRKEPESDIDSSEKFPLPRTYQTPPTGYRPGKDAEFDYGISTPQSAQDIQEYSRMRQQRQFYGGGVVKALGPIRLAAGGIASLDGMDTQTVNMEAPAGGNEKDLVVEAIRAIKGQVEDPRPALGRFLAKYGEDALRELVDKVQSGKAEGEASKDGGRVQGPGDGMDDRVPAKIKETGEDVLLADSEYVVPADVVSHLGNGSSEAGAKALDSMLDRVRESRTGKKTQAPAINAKEALPA